jgi:hypothetical protein
VSARSFNINKTTKQSNIQVYHESNSKAVKLHNTIVFCLHSDDKITLNSGGWKTNTTKTAINRAFSQLNLDGHISQVKGQWFVTFNGETVKFDDGMTLRLDPLMQALN